MVHGVQVSAEVPPPSWVLISVLFSTFPLEQGLALALHRVALDLYRREAPAGPIAHQLAHGQVRNLDQDAAVGSITGPTFEAELETERGAGLVRFILTRRGLELMEQQDLVSGRGAPRYLN
jgi:hypothetical protein